MTKKTRILFSLFTVISVLVIVIIVFAINFSDILDTKKIAFVLLIFFIFIYFLVFIVSSYFIFKRAFKIREGINFLIEDHISNEGIGVIFYSSNGKIIWSSKFIKEIFDISIFGKSLEKYFDFAEKMRKKEYNFSLEHKDLFYDVQIIPEKQMIIFNDKTIYYNLFKNQEEEKIVVGEIEIDNFLSMQASLSEEELLLINKTISNLFENLSKNGNIDYRQYVNGKFLVTTDKQTLEYWKSEDFISWLDIKNYEENEKDISKKINITLSGGFGMGFKSISKLTELAKQGLAYSQSRGGDQFTIINKNERPLSFGSHIEIDANESRTGIKEFAEKLDQKLSSADIKKIVIYGHQKADLDALGSAYALAKYIQIFINKDVKIQNFIFDSTTDEYIKNNFSNEDNSLLITPTFAQKYSNSKTLVILVDVNDPQRIENKLALEKILPQNIFVIDHHRINKEVNFCPRNQQYIDPQASSSSEIITEILQFLVPFVDQQKITPQMAQILLNGIYIDTNRFQKAISSKTFSAASVLSRWGAKAQIAINSLRQSEKIHREIQQLIQNLIEIKPGYFLAWSEIEVDVDVISMAADQVLNIEGRKASFVVGKTGKNEYKLSARGINTNVQIIAERVGGGGHFSAAAASTKNEPLEVFVDNIKQAIVGVK